MKNRQENLEEFEEIPEDYLENQFLEDQFIKEANITDLELSESIKIADDLLGEDIAEHMADLRLEDEKLAKGGH